VLSDALQELSGFGDENLLVGFETSDDAAVYRLTPDIALVSSVDYITPPVDDPWWFGQIAAANSLSDIYAMGGKPLTALNLVMFPSQKLDLSLLKRILQGGSEKIKEARASMAGGHSVDDNEPKYGLAVTGQVHPERILTNRGCRLGDALVLTKPLGTGVLFNANRSGKLPYGELEPILPQVAALNDVAIETALNFETHACTDITGFGILGHGLEMAKGGNVQIEFVFDSLPRYPNARQMYRRGETTGSNKANRQLADGYWESAKKMTAEAEELLFDPQTSGGLLLCVPESEADELVKALHTAGVAAAAKVARVVAADRPFVTVV
jgi:selenide,water dikinase